MEVALPLNDLAAGRTFSMALQVCDITSDDPANGTASGNQVPSIEYTLVGEAEAPAEDADAPADTVVDETPAEETSNVGIIIAIIAAVIAIAAIAVVVVKKKKTK